MEILCAFGFGWLLSRGSKKFFSNIRIDPEPQAWAHAQMAAQLSGVKEYDLQAIWDNIEARKRQGEPGL